MALRRADPRRAACLGTKYAYLSVSDLQTLRGTDQWGRGTADKIRIQGGAVHMNFTGTQIIELQK